MKLKRIFQHLLVNDATWFLLRPLTYLGKRLESSRGNFLLRKQEDANEALCAELFRSKTVLHGLFKGMQMGDIKPTASSVYAKLLGSYESEIMSDLSKLLDKQYDLLINVGSDEGYYAVGIARLHQGIKVYAFDCNKNAQDRCRDLAVLNEVEDHITIKGCFDAADLPFVAADEKVLFIIDCEGCESEIVTKQLVQSFSLADFIIELHFEKDPLVADKFHALFGDTHNIQLVNALSDHERIMQYEFAEIAELGYQQKKYILNERNNFMQWFIATAK